MMKEQAKALKQALKKKHPWCRVCGWAKGGQDSWDGYACKCGHTSLPFKVCAPCMGIGMVPIHPLGNETCSRCSGSGVQ